MFSNTSLDKITEAEYIKRITGLDIRYKKGEKLNPEEIDFFCSCQKFEYLTQFPICIDEFFKRAFLMRQPNYPKELNFLKPQDNAYYELLVKEWDTLVEQKQHINDLLHIVCKETRQELKQLRKKYDFRNGNNLFRVFLKEKSRIVEWSKYRYIFIKKIFETQICEVEFILKLNGQEIIFDYYSLTHILTRHFAQIIKPYFTDKDHFTENIGHNEIHLKLKWFFDEIEKSGVYLKDSIQEVNVKYKNQLYKIFCRNHIKPVKGSPEYLRVDSFFPLTNQTMLGKLNTDFEGVTINEDLTVFVRK